MPDEGAIVIRIAPDSSGLQQIRALITELKAEAALASKSRGGASRAAAEIAKLRKEQEEILRNQAKLAAQLEVTGSKAVKAFSEAGKAADAFGTRVVAASKRTRTGMDKAAAGARHYTKATFEAAEATRMLQGTMRGVSGALGNLWLTYTAIIPTIASFGAAISLRKAMKEGADFEFQLRAIQGIAQSSFNTIEKLRHAVLGLGRTSLQGPLELASGLRILTQAGFSATEALTALPAVSKLAVVGQLDLSKATTIASGAMHQFNLEASDLGGVVDALSKSAALSATTIEQIGGALSYTASLSTTLGMKLETVAGMLSVLATRSITGSKAATSLQRSFLNMAAGTPKVKRALKELGVHVFDATGKFRGAVPVIQDLAKALSQYTQEAQTSFLRDIAGLRGIKALTVLVETANSELPRFVNEIKDATDGLGFANKQLLLMADTAEGQAKIAWNNFVASLIEGANGAEESMKMVAAAAAEMFASEEFKRGVTTAINGIAAVTKALIDYREVIFTLGTAYFGGKFLASVGSAIGGLGELKAVEAMSVAYETATMAAEEAGEAFVALRGAWAAAGAGLSGFIELLTGPVGLVALLAGAAAGVYKLHDALFGIEEIKTPNLTLVADELERIAKLKFENVQTALDKIQGITKEQRALSSISDKRKLQEDLIYRLELQRNALQEKIKRGRKGSLLSGFGGGGPYGLSQDEADLKALNIALGKAQAQLTYLVAKEQSAKQYIEKAKAAQVALDIMRKEQKAGLKEGTKTRAGSEEGPVLATPRTGRISSFSAKRTRGTATLPSEVSFVEFLRKTTEEAEKARRKSLKEQTATSHRISLLQQTDFFGYRPKTVDILEQQAILQEEKANKIREIKHKESLARMMKDEEGRAQALEALSAQKLAVENEYEQKRTELALQYSMERRRISIEEGKILMSSTSQTLGAIADLIGEEDEKSFKRAKRFRIAAATMDAVAGAAGAFADTHGNIYVRIAAGIAALAVGLARVEQIRKTKFQGQAHDGLPEVPATGTYILERGERVVKKEDNKKLQKFLDREAQAPRAQQTNVVINISAVDAPSVERLFRQNEGLVHRIVQNAYDQRLATGGPLR
jgi:TP901 family phage tail tape measure protein